MEFRQLEYFYTISKLENFTRTAEVLHVSQPSVTKAIKALEAELQLTLVDRSQKHVTLTLEGQAFLLHVEKIMQAVEEAQQDMKRFQKDVRGQIRFGIPPMVEAYVFPDLFTSFRQQYPDVELNVQEYNDSLEIQKKLEEGELDFGIVLGESDQDTRNRMLILSDTMTLCLHKDHPLAALDAISFAQLQQEKFIMQQPNTYQYHSVYARCVENGFTPDILLCTTQVKTIKQLVANHMGVSILPDFVTRSETIFVRKPLTPPLRVHVHLLWGSEKCLSIWDQKFIDFMRRYSSTNEFKKFYRQK